MGSCASTKITPTRLKSNRKLDFTTTKTLSLPTMSPRKKNFESKAVQTSQKSFKKKNFENQQQKNITLTETNRKSNSFSPLFSKRHTSKQKKEEEKLNHLNLNSSIKIISSGREIKAGNRSLTIDRSKLKLKILGDSFHNSSFNSSFNRSLTVKPKTHQNQSKSGFVVRSQTKKPSSFRGNGPNLFNLYEALEENEDDENYDKIQDDVKQKINDCKLLTKGTEEETGGVEKVKKFRKNDHFNFRRNSLVNRLNFSKLNVSRIQEVEEEKDAESSKEDNKSHQSEEEFEDAFDGLSNEKVYSNAGLDDIETMFKQKKENMKEMSFIDMIGRKDGLILARDLMREEFEEHEEHSDEGSDPTSSSSGLFFDIPTPGLSESRNPFS